MRGEVSVTQSNLPRQLFVVVERGNAGMRMRLAPADLGGERFAVVNGKIGIAAIEYIGHGNRSSLTEAYHVFRKLDLQGEDSTGRDRLLQVFSQWQEALARSGIAISVEREALYGSPLPRHAWAAGADGVSLRPWDIELTALQARLRRVVKLDQVPAQFVNALVERTEQRGFMVELVTAQRGDGSATLLVSPDSRTLAEAAALERQLLVHGSDQSVDGASAQLGELLGYPPCCIERFGHVAEHNDTTLAWALLPEPTTSASPLSQWLQPGLALLSHSPCALSCAASIALAQRLLDAVDGADPGGTARWRALATRVQVVDRDGNRLALALDESLDSPQRILAADLLSAKDSPAPLPQRTSDLVGQRVVLENSGLVAEDREWYAPYVADHRGQR